MGKTARMVMKIVGASLALVVAKEGLKARVSGKRGSEYDDYNDGELYG